MVKDLNKREALANLDLSKTESAQEVSKLDDLANQIDTKKELKNELAIELLKVQKQKTVKILNKREALANLKKNRLLAKLQAFDSSLAKNCHKGFNNCEIKIIKSKIKYLDYFIYSKLISIIQKSSM
ncbi:7162_t:CDS:1 [Cetraspora pellucida]|uniref:7162_t:CDS:1 n=1 Tax=Cetraspora pellucida TaxID=1433469 RepID=A0ACA9M1U7_9GLOM|nr:7162_t:CDS:1 [Cetraspora pellucida]